MFMDARLASSRILRLGVRTPARSAERRSRPPCALFNSFQRSRIPIVSEERLSIDKPDFVVIFPWNISDEVKTQLNYLSKSGTKFVVAVPNLQIS